MGMKSLKIRNEVITNRSSEAFKRYLQEVAQIPLLVEDEETELAIKIKNGDKQALDKLIRSNLRFVISVAKQYQDATCTIEDLVNEGNIGLCSAAEKFDHTKGFKFISYAVHWIRRYIIDYKNSDSKLVRIPLNKLNDLHKLNKIIGEIEHELGRNADPSDLYDALGDEYSEKDINNLLLLNKQSHVSSMDKTDEDGCSLYDVIPDDYVLPADHYMINEHDKHIVQVILNKLKPQYKMVIIHFYGLDGNPPMDLNGIAEKLDVSRERVRVIKDVAFNKMEQIMRRRQKLTYLDIS
jgi:RNA polymerase primary sigma factor